MRSLTERQSLLLELLREAGHPMTGKALSDLLGISPRTLRNDIARINRSATTSVITADGLGYAINWTAYQELIQKRPNVEAASTDDRLLVFLLNQPNTSVYDIAIECYYSDSSVRPALDRLAPRLERYQLGIRTSGSRVELTGSERDRRRLLGDLVSSALDAQQGKGQQLRRLLPGVDLVAVELAIKQSLRDQDLSLDDITKQNLVTNIAISLQRAKHEDDYRSTQGPDNTGLLQATIANLHRFGLGNRLTPAAEDEVARLVWVALETQAPIATATVKSAGEVEAVVTQAVNACIARFDLDTQREKLIGSLTQHTLRLIARSDAFVLFRNGLRESLRTMSPFLFDVAVYLAHDICSTLSISITDDEISLYAIYLGLYTNNPDQPPNTVSVIVVCPRYQILREWLLARLVELFGERIDIIDVVTTVEEAESRDSQLVISTVGGRAGHSEVVEISALCSDLDVAAIESALAKAKAQSERNYASQALHRFLAADLFFVNEQFPDSTSTIEFLGGQLHEKQRVPASFTQSALVREGYSSTAFAPRFAVPHSMEFIAHQTSIAVLIPKSPIDWGELDVVMVFMLAINPDDYEDFSFLYQHLIRQLCRPEVLSKLRNFSEFENFRDYLADQLAISSEVGKTT